MVLSPSLHFKVIPMECEEPPLGECDRVYSEGSEQLPMCCHCSFLKDRPDMPLSCLIKVPVCLWSLRNQVLILGWAFCNLSSKYGWALLTPIPPHPCTSTSFCAKNLTLFRIHPALLHLYSFALRGNARLYRIVCYSYGLIIVQIIIASALVKKGR